MRLLALAAGLLVSGAVGAGEASYGPKADKIKADFLAGDPAAKAAMESLADKGDSGARVLLGGALFSGIPGIAIDEARACKLWELAASSSAYAEHLHAECLQMGHGGLPRDPAKARVQFQAAADRGFAKSKCALGNMLITGEGGSVDASRGVTLCREGAEAGDADAQTDLANYYLVGKIVPRDAVAARSWYEKAVAQGHRNAAYTLGQIYWNGDGVAKDNVQAAKLWRYAYDMGRLEAAVLLGDEAFVRSSQENGRRDKAAMDEAIAWYEAALARDASAAARIGPRLDMLRKIKAAER
jgi:uncharacterized protein